MSGVNERIAERVREKEKVRALAQITTLTHQRRTITSALSAKVRLAKHCGATHEEIAAAGVEYS